MAEYKVIGAKHNLYTIELPKEMKGEFILPKGENVSIFVNNKKINSKSSSAFLNSGLNRIEIKK